MDIKRIKFERTGGFAGIRFAADFELDDLPKDQAHQILELLGEMDFDELPEHISGNQQVVADGFNYSITVVTEKRQQTVNTSDTAAPKKMEPLLEILTKIAKQQARKKK